MNSRRLRIVIVLAVGLLLTTGILAISLAERPSVLSSIGEAVLSGAILGAVFIAIERALSSAADLRSRQESMRRQLTMTDSLLGIDLRNAELEGIYMPSRTMSAGQLDGVQLQGAIMFYSRLEHALLRGASLQNAELGGSALRHADLSLCQAAGADFVDCDATAATFVGADLTGADFTSSLLKRANFQGATMSGVRLKRCDLSGADLRDAILAGCDLTEITYDDSTQWPSDFAPVPESTERRDDWSKQLSLEEWLVRRRQIDA